MSGILPKRKIQGTLLGISIKAATGNNVAFDSGIKTQFIRTFHLLVLLLI